VIGFSKVFLPSLSKKEKQSRLALRVASAVATRENVRREPDAMERSHPMLPSLFPRPLLGPTSE